VTPKGKPIFPRLDMDEEVAYIKEKMSEGSQTRRRKDQMESRRNRTCF
jgi:methionyl-tRNA synthetase